MIIELYGLPGSGKSTLARKLEADGQGTIVRVTSLFELVWRNVLFMARHPVAFWSGFWYVVAHAGGWKLWYYKFMNSFLQCNAKYQKARRFSKAIIDQGFFQNILGIFEEPQSEEVIRRFLKHFPHPGRLIVFAIPESRRQQLLGQRNFIQRSQFGEQYRKRWEEVIKENDATLRALLPKLDISYQSVS